MKIKAILDANYKQVFVPAFIFSPHLGKDALSLTLLIDTGATHTTILQGNALRLGVDFSKLKLSSDDVLGVSGKQSVYELNDVTLAFQGNSSSSDLVLTKLDKIHAVKPNKRTVPSTMSVLGMDVLQKMHFDYCNPRVNLTCNVRKVNGTTFIR